MEAEFVNAYVERQREMIHDLVSRNIMLEAQLKVADTKRQALETQHSETAEKLTQTEAELVKRIEGITALEKKLAEVPAKDSQLKELTNKLNAVSTQVGVLNAELGSIRTKYNNVVVERDDLAKRLDDITKKATTLVEHLP